MRTVPAPAVVSGGKLCIARRILPANTVPHCRRWLLSLDRSRSLVHLGHVLVEKLVLMGEELGWRLSAWLRRESESRAWGERRGSMTGWCPTGGGRWGDGSDKTRRLVPLICVMLVIR